MDPVRNPIGERLDAIANEPSFGPDFAVRTVAKARRKRKRTLLLSTLAVSAVLVVSAGGIHAVSAHREAGYAAGGDNPGPVIALDDPLNSFPSAEIAGTLQQQGDCLILNHAVVIWPSGTSWDAKAKSVHIINDSTVRVGDTVQGMGGYYPLSQDNSSVFGVEQAGRASTCAEQSGASNAVLFTPSS